MSTQPSVDIRQEFPIRERFAFLNHASVSPIPVSTQSAISEFARAAAEEGPVNYASWLHAMAMARENCADMINADNSDICFIKNTNHGLLIVSNSINWKPGDNVIGLEHEFPANLLPWKNLSHYGVEFRGVPEQPDYTYSIDDIVARMDDRTRLLSVSWVEYSTGVRNDIYKLGEICRERGIMFCVDGIQGLGVLPVDVKSAPIDFLMADGHKWLLAPEGCGYLYIRRELIPELNDNMAGWCGMKNPQDYDNTDQGYKPTARKFEEGSHNLLAINALGTSIRVLQGAGAGYVESRIRQLTTHLMEAARSKGYDVITPDDWQHRAGIVSLRKDGLDIDATAKTLLEEHKIVIAARRGFLRVSPHFYNDEEELDRLVAALP
jgi:cysteine desulfurase/selenocysteine lyase